MSKKTAMMLSIERKETRLKWIERETSGLCSPAYANELFFEKRVLTKELQGDKELLQTEREQIEEAYFLACHDSQNFIMNLSDDDELNYHARHYYNTTYKTGNDET